MIALLIVSLITLAVLCTTVLMRKKIKSQRMNALKTEPVAFDITLMEMKETDRPLKGLKRTFDSNRNSYVISASSRAIQMFYI